MIDIARFALPIVVLIAATAARGAERWQTLPPTPSLPHGTVNRHAETNGARLWYAEWGRAGAHAPVVLLHLGAGSSNYYGALVPALVAHGYRVIALDTRGHGRSTRSEAPLSYELMADDVVALLDRLGIAKASVVGWSDGGIVGLALARRNPARVARLFAFGANADPSGARDDADKNPTFAAYLARAAEEYRQLSPTPDGWPGLEAALEKLWSAAPNFTADELKAIRVPVTIADGEHDEAIRPEHTRYLAATIPGARLVILPGLSHFAFLQDPQAANAAVLEFLAK